MAFILSPFAIVSGSDRPKVFGHLSGRAWAVANDGTNALVYCEPVGAENGQINSDQTLAVLNPSAYARFGLPDNGARDEKAIIDWVARCLLLRQLVPGLPIDLTGKFEDSSKAIQDALKGARNGDKALDTSEAKAGRDLGAVIQALAEQLPIRTEPRAKPLKGGTAVDTFEGEVGTVNLGDHTPSGSPAGTGWTHVGGGAANQLQVTATGVLTKNGTTGGGAWHLAPAQVSANQYIKATGAATAVSGVALCNRSTDQSNQFFTIIAGTNRGLWKIDTGSPTELAVITDQMDTDEVQEYQVDGDAHEVFLDSSSIAGPVTDAFNNTVKNQGLRSSSDASPTDLFKDMEIGVLTVTGGTGRSYPYGTLGGAGKVGRAGLP